LGHRKRLLKAITALNMRAAGSRPPVTVVSGPKAEAAERRQLTVMFCDLVGSTALAARLGWFRYHIESEDSQRWWSKGDSNCEPLSDAFVNFSQFEGRGDAIGDGPERVDSGRSLATPVGPESARSGRSMRCRKSRKAHWAIVADPLKAQFAGLGKNTRPNCDIATCNPVLQAR